MVTMKKEVFGTMLVQQKENIPAGNPFLWDAYNMGITVGKNCTVMMGNHTNEVCTYLIVVNTDTGERILINF